MHLSHHVIAHLPFLAAVARCRSFTRAAESLHVSQAAVSYQIRQLEQKLGVLLVVRQSGSRIHLTSAGQSLVEEYLECEKRLQLTLDNLGSAEPRGTLRMTVPVDFGSLVLPAALARLGEVAPGLKLDLNVSDEVLDLVANQFDIAIRTQTDSPGLGQRRLTGARKQVVASRDYLAKHGTPACIAELARHRLLIRGGKINLSWTQLLEQEGKTMDDMPDTLSLGNTFALAEGVRNGLGIAILPQFILIDDIDQGRVVPLLLQYSAALVTEFYLAHPPAPQISRLVQVVEPVIQEVLALPRFRGCFQG